MKRGKKNDEKVVVGPFFPRLHVNDTMDKGGPRAPPRNKMALYEQFTVPFQRFNPNSNSSSNDVPLGPERTYSFPVRLPSQMPALEAESYIPDTPLSQLEQREKVDKDDSRAYDHSKIDHSNDKTLKSFNGKSLTPMGSRIFTRSEAGQNDGDTDETQLSSLLFYMKKAVRSKQQPVMSVNNRSTGEVIDSPLRQGTVIPDQEDQHCPVSNIIPLHQGDACIQQECITGSQSNDIQHDSTMDMYNRNTHVIRGCVRSTRNQSCPLEAANGTEYLDTRNDSPIQNGSSDESDDLSKMSTVESLSSLELSLDGVAKILGQKTFWKARRRITNQQRVFAVQVFELHRLLKVQQLIAESPDVILEDAALLGKFPLEGSTPENLSLEIVVEPQPQNVKQQDHSEKLSHKKECSAENAVGKTSFSSPKNGSNFSNYTFFYGNPHQANVVSDDKMDSWRFNPSPAQQWLIPVMSPSEGLVYKPYPGPFGQGPLDGTFINPAYGVPSFHQAIAVSPFIPPGSYGCFPPHAAPVTNHSSSGSAVVQANQFAAPGSHGQNGHSAVEGGNFNNHNQNSCNLPNQKNGATATPFLASKKRELQGTSASSPSETVQQIRSKKFAKGRDAHSSPFLTASLVSGDVLQSLETRQQPTQVIKVVPRNPRSATQSEDVLQSLEIGQHAQVVKVVPRNPRSATESAARIFQSIQEERKQYDLV